MNSVCSMNMMKQLTERIFRSRKRRPDRVPSMLSVEPLETRDLLAVSPLLWADNGQITISFAPDGTDIAGRPNELQATFNQIGSSSEWQQAVLRAFQTWSDSVAVNFGVVADEGQPFGVPGPRTDDSRFGDIRIGAIVMGEDVAAVSIADSAALSGTWVGDLVFNSNAEFETTDDLFAVALHEVGHVLGLSHSSDPDSVMHRHGDTTVRSLSSDDIKAAQSFNGIRVPDLQETVVPNDSFETATFVAPTGNGFDVGEDPLVLFADISNTTDVDMYQIDNKLRMRSDKGPPENYRGPATINVHTSGVSLLSPMITLLDRNGNELDQARSSDSGGGNVTLHIEHIDPSIQYFARVEANEDTPFAIGSYTLTVTYDDLLTSGHEQLENVVTYRNRGLTRQEIHGLLNSSHRFDTTPGSNDSISQAEHLVSRREFAFATNYDVLGTISDKSPVDFFRFSTPNLEEDSATMSLLVQSLDEGGLIPKVTIYNNKRDVMPSQILANGGGELIVQANVDSNAIYFVEVAAGDALFADGNYRLNLSYGNEAVEHDMEFDLELTTGKSEAINLFVAQTQLFHFLLSVNENGDNQDYVDSRLVDSEGETVYRLSSFSGQQRSSSAVLLKPGTYKLVMDSFGDSEKLSVRYDSLALSDPFVVEPEDTIDEPIFGCPDSDEVFCYPGGMESDAPFLWDEFLESLGDLPEAETTERIPNILGDWWSWYWQQQNDHEPVLGSADSYTAQSGITLSVPAESGVLSNDMAPNGQSLIAILLEPPKHGILDLEPTGAFAYTSTPGFIGSDSFQYMAHDFNLDSAPVTVSLNSVEPIADFDGDHLVTATDIDLLCGAIHDGDRSFDLTGDTRTTRDDYHYLVVDVLGTTKGDANLDGIFNSGDLITVFQAGLYESASETVASWAAGDWNCSLRFDTTDLVDAFTEGGYTVASTRSVAAAITASEEDRKMPNRRLTFDKSEPERRLREKTLDDLETVSIFR